MERLIAGAVQSELNSIFNTQLDVDGWYGKQSAGTVKDLQKELSLPATGVLDVQTFYQLQLAVESGAKYKRTVTPVNTSAGKQPTAGKTGTNYAPSSVPGDYNGNGIPDQYDKYAQGTSYTAPSSARTNYAPSSVPGDYNGNGIPDQYDSYAQGTGNAGGPQKSPYTYDINPDINIDGNRAYMFQGGIQDGNNYVGGSINAYAITGTAEAKALLGWESNFNGTKVERMHK